MILLITLIIQLFRTNHGIYIYSQTKKHKSYRKKDIVWKNVTVDMVELFYAEDTYNCKYKDGKIKRNKKGDKIMLGYDAHRKYINAFTYGKTLVKQKFNKLEISKPLILKSLRIANAKQKGKGQIEEGEADPIPRPLCEYMCKDAISAGDAFWCFFTLLQWNCMVHSQNIDNLRFTNFKVADDSIVVNFNQTKMDKEDKKNYSKTLLCQSI